MNSKAITTHNHPDLIEKDLREIDKENVSYDDYVSMGKELIKRVEVYQARIAFYACKVCQIRHGGRSAKFYTLTDYAKDIGVNPRTLHEWSLIYRNVILKLDIDVDSITKDVWKVASRVNDNIEWKIRRENKEDGTPHKKSKYKSQIDKNTVQRMYDDEKDEPSFISEIRLWTCNARNMKNTIVKRELKLAHRGDLLNLMETLDFVSDHINDFLTNNREH